MLTDVPVIDQKSLGRIFRVGIREGKNIMILGPSGGGKTFIAVDIAHSEGCRLVYINLAVLERTDFQGFPVISQDKTLVSYATPDFLPFADTNERDEKNALENLSTILNDAKDKNIMGEIDKRLNAVEYRRQARIIANAMPYLSEGSQKSLKPYLNKVLANLPEGKPIVFLFDEVDKAASETMQTLLEFLQFRSINGRKLDIKACLLTGNLPDEHAASQQISHAITKRCKSYKLQLDFNQWREWAYGHAVHDLVVGFLTANPDFLHKTPPDGDPTAYALPSPRTWTDVSDSLWALEKDNQFQKLNGEELAGLQKLLIAGSVGDTAAIKFVNWFKYYRKMDPVVEALLEKGKMPDQKKLDAQELFICALSACSRVYRELKPKNEDKIKKYAKNVYKWIGSLSVDIQMGASRMAFGGDFDNIQKYRLSEIDEFSNVFKHIKKTMQTNDI